MQHRLVPAGAARLSQTVHKECYASTKNAHQPQARNRRVLQNRHVKSRAKATSVIEILLQFRVLPARIHFLHSSLAPTPDCMICSPLTLLLHPSPRVQMSRMRKDSRSPCVGYSGAGPAALVWVGFCLDFLMNTNPLVRALALSLQASVSRTIFGTLTSDVVSYRNSL